MNDGIPCTDRVSALTGSRGLADLYINLLRRREIGQILFSLRCTTDQPRPSLNTECSLPDFLKAMLELSHVGLYSVKFIMILRLHDSICPSSR